MVTHDQRSQQMLRFYESVWALQQELRATFQQFVTEQELTDAPKMVAPDGSTSFTPETLFQGKLADKPEVAARLLALSFALSGTLVLIQELGAEMAKSQGKTIQVAQALPADLFPR